ncbi:MAG: hypothetical protein IJB11_04510 [Oscillospiraceae bacterium]|nr:hypothetical protein [Oscillospiraceae bacterium]
MDWQKIKTEYITTDTSYRKLAHKYGIRVATIGQRARDEKWVAERERYRNETVSKTIAIISDQQAEKMARIEGITDKLLTKLEQAVEELDLEIIKRKTKLEEEGLEVTTETMEAKEGGIIDRAGLRQLTAALKDLKEIQMIKSELDRREQEARIANLQRQAEKDEKKDNKITVVLEGALKDYAQ